MGAAKRCAVVALLLLVACAPPSPEELAGSVVRVEARPCGKVSAGTGSAVGEDLVLTNAHIVAGSSDDVTVRTADDRLLSAVVVGFDRARDLALLSVADLGLGPVELGDAEDGSEALILARPAPVDLEILDVTIVKSFTATGDDIYGEDDVSRRALELAVDVVPGVSGAGVYDQSGRLVGVVFAESRQRDNVAYAVAGEEIRAFLHRTDAAAPTDTLRCR